MSYVFKRTERCSVFGRKLDKANRKLISHGSLSGRNWLRNTISSVALYPVQVSPKQVIFWLKRELEPLLSRFCLVSPRSQNVLPPLRVRCLVLDHQLSACHGTLRLHYFPPLRTHSYWTNALIIGASVKDQRANVY